MPSLKVNVLATTTGKAWRVLSSFLFVPLYLKYLGLEQYSLISFSLVIQSLLAILDSGLTLTLSREFALSRPICDKWKTFRNLENCYLYIVIFIVLVTVAGADVIANSWLNLNEISPTLAANCIRIVGCTSAFQMLGSFYIGGFMGQERMVEITMYNIVCGLIRSGLVVVPLVYIHSVLLFFLWQFVCDILFVVFLRYIITPKEYVPQISFFKIDKWEFERVGKFAGGIFLISIVTAINTQLDKLVVSKIFAISELGIYSLAMTASLAVLTLTQSVTTALQPRFVRIISENKEKEVISLYLQSFLVISLITIALAFVISFNKESIMWIWTGDIDIALKASKYIPLLIIGAASISYQTIPYCIAIGNGNTKYNNVMGGASLIITIPGYLLAGYYCGPNGVACVYAVAQCLITPVYVCFVNKKYLKGVSFVYLVLIDILIPLLAIGGLCYLLSLFPVFNNRIVDLIRVAIIGVVTLLPCIMYIWILKRRHINSYKK